MDYREFEIPKTEIDTEKTYSDEVEFLVKELNTIAHAAGRYSRSVQLPAAIRITETLAAMRESQKLSTIDEALPIYNAVGQSEQLVCPQCGSQNVYEFIYTDGIGCNRCGHQWAN